MITSIYIYTRHNLKCKDEEDEHNEITAFIKQGHLGFMVLVLDFKLKKKSQDRT